MTKKQRLKIYTDTLLRVKDLNRISYFEIDPVYVCVLLYNCAYNVTGRFQLKNNGANMPEIFPEFWAQKPRKGDYKYAWWPQTKYGMRCRIEALKTAIALCENKNLDNSNKHVHLRKLNHPNSCSKSQTKR